MVNLTHWNTHLKSWFRKGRQWSGDTTKNHRRRRKKKNVQWNGFYIIFCWHIWGPQVWSSQVWTILMYIVLKNLTTIWGTQRGLYRVLVGKLEGKRLLWRPRHRWVDNIRMDLQEVGCGYMDWIGRAQDRDRWRTLVSAVMNLQVPWNAGNFLTSCKPVSCSRTLHHGVSEYEEQS